MNATLGMYVILALLGGGSFGVWRHFVHMARKDGHR